jgi:hypothetical protein
MGVEYDGDKLDELLKLTKENNRMLRSMRRNAFWGGIVKFVIWAAFLVIPLWLYLQYVAPVMNSMLDTMAQIEGARTGASAQMSGLNEALQNLRAQFPQYFQGN